MSKLVEEVKHKAEEVLASLKEREMSDDEMLTLLMAAISLEENQ